MTPVVTRFAPSPTGLLHLGHAYSARVGFDVARAASGRFLLRIDDIDEARCRPEFEAAIVEDLAWLGLAWEAPVRRETDHLADYRAALARIEALGLVYPCFCSRKEIRAEIAAMGGAPHGPEGPVYPGTCRGLDGAERRARIAAGEAYALRLDVAAALARTGPLSWHDRIAGFVAADPLAGGDVVLARKEGPPAYHLAVVTDDADQGVTLVTRGQDLFASTHVHRLLQALLDLPVPDYLHHRLITDASGERLAKRADAVAIRALREQGLTPAAVWAMVGLEGLEGLDQP